MTGEQTEGQADGQHSWSKMFTQQVTLKQGQLASHTPAGTSRQTDET